MRCRLLHPTAFVSSQIHYFLFISEYLWLATHHANHETNEHSAAPIFVLFVTFVVEKCLVSKTMVQCAVAYCTLRLLYLCRYINSSLSVFICVHLWIILCQ